LARKLLSNELGFEMRECQTLLNQKVHGIQALYNDSLQTKEHAIELLKIKLDELE
jgi:hypothetical protein